MSLLASSLETSLEGLCPEARLTRLIALIRSQLPSSRCLKNGAAKIGVAGMEDLKSQAIQKGLNLAKQLRDAGAYEFLSSEASKIGISTPSHLNDELWSSTVNESDVLLQKLEQSKVTQVRPVIRAAVVDYVRHCAATGLVKDAANVLRTNAANFNDLKSGAEYNLIGMKLAVLANTPSNLHSYFTKMPPEAEEDHCLAMEGLYHMREQRFDIAAERFSNIKALRYEEIPQEHTVILIQDVAIWAALCSLASDSWASSLRAKFRSESSNFRELLDALPIAREAVLSFDTGNFDHCLQILHRCLPSLYLDYLLSPVLSYLYEAILSRSILAYCSPFSTIRLQTLVTSFEVDCEEIQRAVEKMIEQRIWPFRQDLIDQSYVRVQEDEEKAAVQQTITASQKYHDAAQSLCLRMRLYQYDLLCSTTRTSTNRRAVETAGREENIPRLL